MTELQPKPPVVKAKPQPDIYTLLMVVAILTLGATLILVLCNLTSADGYDMKFAELFGPLKDIVPTNR